MLFMDRTLVATAKLLAESHRHADGGTKIVKLFPSEGDTTVRLLEVSTRSPTIGEVRAFRFTPDPEGGVHFPSEVILVSEEEWERIQAGDIKLPGGWDLGSARDV